MNLHKFSYKFRHLPPPLNKRFINNQFFKTRKEDYITIGYCGRCDPEKGIEEIFKSIALYQNKFRNRNIRLILIGDGSEAHELKRKYPEVEVIITGFVDDVIPYLDKLDAFVLASSTETTSLSSLEAYARGIAIFTKPVGYLGLNAEKFNNVYTFNNNKELCFLIHNHLERTKIGVSNSHHNIKSSIITFSELYLTVTAEYL